MNGIIENQAGPRQQELQSEDTAEGLPTERQEGKSAYRTQANKALPQSLQEPFGKLVLAGMKVMYSPQTQDLVKEQMDRDVEPWRKIGESAAGLMGILLKQAKGTPPIPVVISAAIELTAEIGDFFTDAGMQISDEDKRRAMQYVTVILLKGVGANPEQIQQAMMGQAPQQPTQQPPQQPMQQPMPQMG